MVERERTRIEIFDTDMRFSSVFGVFLLLGALGFLITELTVPDLTERFSESRVSDAQDLIANAQPCLDHPLEQLLIQKFDVVSLLREDFLAAQQRENTVEQPRPIQDRSSSAIRPTQSSLVPEDSSILSRQPTYKGRVVAYTLFALPVFTISVEGSSANIFYSCSKVKRREI